MHRWKHVRSLALPLAVPAGEPGGRYAVAFSRSLPVSPLATPSRRRHATASDVYVVEKILQRRKFHNGECEYEIKWVGWPDSKNSWEPSKNIIDQTMLTAFNDQVKKRVLSGPTDVNLILQHDQVNEPGDLIINGGNYYVRGHFYRVRAPIDPVLAPTPAPGLLTRPIPAALWLTAYLPLSVGEHGRP